MKRTTTTHATQPNTSERATNRTGHRSWSSALEQMYLASFDRLVHHAERVVQDRSLAEECVQDAFLAFHTKEIATAPGAEFAYLRTMVRNAAISLVRSQQRGRDVCRRLPMPGHAPSPEDAVVARLTADDVARQVASLAPRQAEVIELRWVGMSVAETAQFLNVSDGTVKTHRHRAAEVLRQSFQVQAA